MKNARFFVLMVVAGLVLATLACGFSFSTANISSAKLTTDSAGTQETTVFTQDQVFYCIVELANAPDDTTVKAVWTAVDVEDTEPNFIIDQAEVTSGDGQVTFDLSNNLLWPTGQYKVELYLNDELEKTLEFEVR
jgi:hypothetical protein